jgi:uracil-DNA glycosylase family 4
LAETLFRNLNEDAFITAAVCCAPPDNKPTPQEIANCLPHLEAELAAVDRVQTTL